jgi:integrase
VRPHRRCASASSPSWRCARPRWYYLGDADAIGLADARRLASRISLLVAEGKDPAAERKAERGAGTFADLHARYLEYAKRKNKSWRHAERLVRRYVLPRWGKLQATTISRADVKALMASIEAPVLCNTIVNATSAIFTWGLREEIVPSNPCRLIERHATTSRERVLSDSELPRFWAAFNDAGLVTACALRTILLTGQRPGEIAAMRREHIVDGGWWQLPGAPMPELGWPGTKNGASHRVWLPAPVQKIIAELGDGTSGFVFEGQTIHKAAAAMRDVCRALGVKDKVTPHDLRRSFCSRVTKLGFGRPAMDRLANHRQRSISDVYDRHSYEIEDRHSRPARSF